MANIVVEDRCNVQDGGIVHMFPGVTASRQPGEPRHDVPTDRAMQETSDRTWRDTRP